MNLPLWAIPPLIVGVWILLPALLGYVMRVMGE